MNNLGTTTGYLKEYFQNDPDMLKLIVALAIPLDLDDAISWTIIGYLRPNADNTLFWEIKRLDFVFKKPDNTFYFEQEARNELLSLVFSLLDDNERQKIHELLALSYQQKLANFTGNSQASLYFENCLKTKIGYHLIWLNRPDEARIVWQSILDDFTDQQSATYVQMAISLVELEHDILTRLMSHMAKMRERIGQR